MVPMKSPRFENAESFSRRGLRFGETAGFQKGQGVAEDGLVRTHGGFGSAQAVHDNDNVSAVCAVGSIQVVHTQDGSSDQPYQGKGENYPHESVSMETAPSCRQRLQEFKLSHGNDLSR